MFDGTFALLERSLRIDIRSRSTHLIRFGLMIAIYISLCNAVFTQDIFGAPGLRFFGWIIYLDLAFLTLTGIGFFATTITEEKEEDTLGLMLMAGISPLGILIGKSLGGLWQTMLVIAVQIPFILLSITMGGVTQQQVWAATVALLAYVTLMAGMGVLCSTISSHGRAAVRIMCLMIGAYVTIPLIANSYLEDYIRNSLSSGSPSTELDWWSTFLKSIVEFSIFTQIGQVLGTSFDESAFSFQAITNFLAGVLCGGLSWLVFGRATRDPSAEAVTRELVTQRNRFSLFSTDRAWDNSFMWKDFHFVGGGVGMMLVRMISFGGAGLLPFVMEMTYGDNGEWVATSMMLMLFGASISAANVLSRSMYDEIRGQTLSSLMMLPTTPARIVYSKYAGALLGWIPIFVCGPIALLTSSPFRRLISDFFAGLERNSSNWTPDFVCIFSLVILLYAMFFILVPHMAAYLATYVRWGAVPLAFGLTMGVYIVGGTCISLLSLAFTMNQSNSTIGIIMVLLFCDLVLILLCAACHVSVLLRVQQLAAK